MIALQPRMKRYLIVGGALGAAAVVVAFTFEEEEATAARVETDVLDGVILSGDTRPASLEAVAAKIDDFRRELDGLRDENARLKDARRRDLEQVSARLSQQLASADAERRAEARAELAALRAEMAALGVTPPEPAEAPIAPETLEVREEAEFAASPEEDEDAPAVDAAADEATAEEEAGADADPLLVTLPPSTPGGLTPSPRDEAGTLDAEAGGSDGEPAASNEGATPPRVLDEAETRALFRRRDARPSLVTPASLDARPGAAPGAAPAGGHDGALRLVTSVEIEEVERRPDVGGSRVFLPAGSIFSGVLLTGLDAPGGAAASANPVPVLLRIKHEAILPNRFSANVRECFVLLSSFGDLSTERAQMRAEALSCILRDGTVIQEELKAYAVGEDGKAGVRGRVVTRQGAFIARAITVGVLDGIAQAFDRSTDISVAAGGAAGGTDALVSGLGAGFASALERVADWYLDQASQLFPVIEVDNGRQIDVVLTSGLEFRVDL